MFEILIWTLFAFLLGSIPFSYVIGRLVLRSDIRQVGDGNPGGTNVLKAGGLKAGLPAILLDILKGFLPVYLAQHAGLGSWDLVPVALAAPVGHALQPFLRLRGGKALGATGGSWVALIGLWAFPVYAVGAIPVLLLQTSHAWSALGGMFALLAYAAVIARQPFLMVIAGFNILLTAWTHRNDLRRAPVLRDWLTGRLKGREA